MFKAVFCPECSGSRIYKDGFRYTNEGQIQRFLCRICGFRFSNNPYKQCQTNRNHQLCVIKKAKKLDSQTETKTVAGESQIIGKDIKSKVVNHLWWLKKQGYSEETIKSRSQIMRQLATTKIDLMDPDAVQSYIAEHNWSPGRRANVIYAYALFAKYAGLKFCIPRISLPEKLPFIPKEREIDDLIAATSKYIATFLQLCKDTGARSGEIAQLKWNDIDFESSTVSITPEKGSNPRISKLSQKAIQMINQLPRNFSTIFIGHYKYTRNLRRTFEKQRKSIAIKMGNPRLIRIHFHTLRHWKGTNEYRKTKDIIHVMQVLGHRRIQNTLKYIQLAKVRESTDYVCKVAKDDKEISLLIEAGFEFICDNDGLKFFRKPK